MNGQRPPTRHYRVAAAVGAAILLLTGCSGRDKASPSTTTRYPPTIPVENEPLAEGAGACGLLSRAEVEEMIGPVNPGSGVRTKTSESCSWRLRSNRDQFVAVITSTPGRAAYDNAMSRVSGAEPLSGVGDRAFVVNDTAYALKGDTLVIVEVLSSQPLPARKQAAVKLLSMVVPRS